MTMLGFVLEEDIVIRDISDTLARNRRTHVVEREGASIKCGLHRRGIYFLEQIYSDLIT